MQFIRFVAWLAIAATTTMSPPAFAQAEKQALIQKIAVAQGLLDMFDQQLAQQQQASQVLGAKMLEDVVRQAGGTDNDRARKALERFVSRSAQLFSAQELVGAWSADYGKGLSVTDLQGILSYYESPIGKKDVAASKAALVSFSNWMNERAQSRLTPLLNDYLKELKAAYE